jgi:hypothetical protein
MGDFEVDDCYARNTPVATHGIGKVVGGLDVIRVL